MDPAVPLPAGTITFLFTDIEGSTRLWEQHPEAMRPALVRHDALVSEAVEQLGGVVIKRQGEGDSFFAVFGRPTDAVAAAWALQRAVTAELWPWEIPLRVRVALHTGEAEQRDGDYYGLAINRCARLRAAASGGQILLSLATQELIRDHLPGQLSLRDLGEHRLKDLVRPERVFQLLAPDLPGDFPPLRTLDSLPNNLPQQLTSFVGREREMVEVKRLLGSTRLLTLTGAGGTGKTRLSLQAAAEVMEEYPDGAWLVELASLSDPELVPQVVATALSVRDEPGIGLVQTLVEHLKLRRLLLILDNCEHLLSACAQLAETMLRQCAGVTILASSREGLGIAGESLYPVPSLSLPDPEQLTRKGDDLVSSLTQYESVYLFIERAVAVRPDFTLTRSNAPAVAEVCSRLDGIPLAIELAAVRVRALPVEQIATRLDNRFRLLTGGSRTALPRQQTLRALIDWSYDLLSKPERVLLRRLSVFAGGWTLEAAEAVCGNDGIEAWEVLELLTALADKSLVTYEERNGEARYHFLETVRQYSQDRLHESGEAEGVRSQHARFFLALAENDAGGEALEREHDNLRAALEWCEAQEDGAFALRMVGALGSLWLGRGHLAEGRQHLARVLSREDTQEPTATRAKALHLAGSLAGASGYHDQGERFHQESLAIQRTLGDKRGIAESLLHLGYTARDIRRYPLARTLLEESLAVAQETGSKSLIAYILVFGGKILMAGGDHVRTRAYSEQGLTLSQELGAKHWMAVAHDSLALADRSQGDFASAWVHLRESLLLHRDSGFQRFIPNTLTSLAGLVAERQGQADRAARLFGAAEALCEAMGVHLSLHEREEYDRDVTATRAQLDEQTYAAAWAEGQAMSLGAAIAYALADGDPG